MSEITQVESEERACPVCGEVAEPEVDGDYRYWECENEECDTPGYTWGYEKVEDGVRIEGSCSLGIPEDVRRRASAPMEAAQRQSGPTFIGSIGRRPDEQQ